MKFFKSIAIALAAAAASPLWGMLPAKADTFTFSILMGTDRQVPNYNPLSHGSVGASLFSGTFTGKDLDGSGTLFYNKRAGITNEITSFKATWGGYEFGLDDLDSFIAGTFPGELDNYYGEDILMRWMRMSRNNIHLDYKPFGRIWELYQQFRVYKCPSGVDCSRFWSTDYAINDGILPPENLLGMQNIANLGFPAYSPKNQPPVKSVPEPNAIAGFGLLALAGWKLRKQRVRF